MATVFDSLRFSLPVKAAEEGAQKILFSVVPDAQKLYCVVASYDESDKPSSSIYSYHSWTILKCRRLIFTLPELIATPELGGLRQIYIIISKNHYDLNKLQPLLKELGLSFQRPTFVVNTTYEACLRYTITARLAPSWNLVGNQYIQGRDFVTVNKPMNSVRIEVTVIGDEIQLLVWPSRVVMSPAVLNNFHLSETADDSRNRILDIESYNIQVYVLPSMKPAKATFLQTKLPKSSPFKSFKEIRRYWKNIYGLRLEENYNLDPTFMYVTVKFNKQHPGLTYPVICLKSNPLITLRPRNESEILKDFLTDLIQRIPNLCGYPFANKAYLGVAMHKLVHPSTFSENPNLTSTVPLRELLTPLHPIFLSDNNNKSNNIVSTNFTIKPRSIAEEELKKNSNTMIWPTASVNSTNSSVTTITLTTTATNTATSRSIHCTNSSASSFAQTISCSLSEPLSSSVVVNKHSSRLPEQLNGFYNNIDSKKKSDEQQFGKPIPIFRPFTSEINSIESLPRPKYAPVFYPRHRTGVKPVTSSYFNSQQASVGHDSITVSQYSHKSPKTSTYVHNNSCHRSSPMKETSITMSSLLKRDTCSLKTYESGVKKRSRPQVQADVDVCAMARSSEGLTRVNTTTLIAYLRAQGIPCKVKDKKGDLVAKVMAHLKTVR